MVRVYRGELLAQFTRSQQGDTLSKPMQEDNDNSHRSMVNLIKDSSKAWEEHLMIIGKELNIAGAELQSDEMEQLREVVKTYADVFHSDYRQLGNFNEVCHDIPTEKERPIRQKPYRTSLQHRDIIRDKVTEMLKDGIVSQST